MNVVMVLRDGRNFGKRDVALLARHIHRTSDVNLFCMTNVPLGIEGVHEIPLEYAWKKWWSRMELYSPRMRQYRPFLYVDLDTAVLDSLNELVEEAVLDQNMYIPLEDFYQGAKKLATGLLWMPLHSDKINRVWVEWMKARCPVTEGRMDNFLRRHIEPDAFWQQLTSRVVSFKPRGLGYLKEPNGASVVCLHGKPSLWEAKNTVKWVKDYVDR